MVTGHVDPAVLDQLAAELLPPESLPPGSLPPGSLPAAARAATASARTAEMAGTAARELVLSRATRLLSGPAGLAAWLRTNLTAGPAATISQPLDIGIPTEMIPPHLRQAVTLRDKYCAFPGCQQRPSACHVHHIIKRSEGGVTSLENCVLA